MSTSFLASSDTRRCTPKQARHRYCFLWTTDARYTRLRSELPAVERLDEDGRMVVLRNGAGYDELGERPRWALSRAGRIGLRGAGERGWVPGGED